jgi:hypothetical protein
MTTRRSGSRQLPTCTRPNAEFANSVISGPESFESSINEIIKSWTVLLVPPTVFGVMVERCVVTECTIDMRKRQITLQLRPAPVPDETWLDIEGTAIVEVSSEEDGYPIESALLHENGQGWRAADAGTQIIRVVFDQLQTLRRITLVFEDMENTRTQEFVLQWSRNIEHSFHEIVRQQWNFSRPDSVREVENYSVELREVAVLELIIDPDKGHGRTRASLRSFRLWAE